MLRCEFMMWWAVAGVLCAGGAAAVAETPLAPEPTPQYIEHVRNTHWSFAPVARPALPAVKDATWGTTPIDAFILAKLEAAGLKPSPRADRRTLIRRAYFDMIGLPPTYEQVEAFVNDTSADAWAKVVESLLASPHYGERWARHWLDVARYADTSGYVGGGGNNRYAFAWTFRDYVIAALNDDKPYDRFIVEQIAADKLELGDDKRPLAAMGFLTVGLRNGGVETIDDRIDVVTRGFMALTVSCARCHDHKYDPIPIEDFYALYGIFESSTEPDEKPVIVTPGRTPEYLAFEAELAKREQAVTDFVENLRVKATHELRDRVADYIVYAAKMHPKHKVGNVQNSGKRGFLRPAASREWRRYIERHEKKWHPVWGVFHELAELGREDFAAKARALIERFDALEKEAGNGPINPLIRGALIAKPPQTFEEAAETIGTLIEDTYRQWVELSKPAEGKAAVTAMPDAAAEQLRQELYAEGTPTALDSDGARANIGQGERDDLRRLEGKIIELSGTHAGAPAAAMVMIDKENPGDSRVYLRGNPGSRGEVAPRRFLSVLSHVSDEPFNNGSGRLQLARAIASEKNPLTPRVMVNRIWHHHFGSGIVTTTSDFGVRSEEPSHPELLDWLAAEFMANNWSLKHMHRLILLSSTYQQSSEPRNDAANIDPLNRLLSRMNVQRLEWEPLRDSLLAVAGRLDTSLYGRPVELFGGKASTRRAVYGFIDRHDLPGTLAIFDFANPDASQPHRPNTTVPQQALYLMNSPFVVEQAKAVVGRLGAGPVAQKIETLYRMVFSRNPTAEEVQIGQAFLAAEQPIDSEGGLEPLMKYAQALLLSNEFAFVE